MADTSKGDTEAQMRKSMVWLIPADLILGLLGYVMMRASSFSDGGAFLSGALMVLGAAGVVLAFVEKIRLGVRVLICAAPLVLMLVLLALGAVQ